MARRLNSSARSYSMKWPTPPPHTWSCAFGIWARARNAPSQRDHAVLVPPDDEYLGLQLPDKRREVRVLGC